MFGDEGDADKDNGQLIRIYEYNNIYLTYRAILSLILAECMHNDNIIPYVRLSPPPRMIMHNTNIVITKVAATV